LLSFAHARAVGEGRHVRQCYGDRRRAAGLRPGRSLAEGAALGAGVPHRRGVLLLQRSIGLYIYASMTKHVRAAVAGANGYAGMTLVDLLARHSDVAIGPVGSRSVAGKPP